MKTTKIKEGGCGYTAQNGQNISTCKDRPIITYCPKCKSVYLCDERDEMRTEMSLKLKDLINFIKHK